MPPGSRAKPKKIRFGEIAKKGIEIEFFFVYNDTVVVLTHCAYCEWGTAP